MSGRDLELISKFRARTAGWGLSDGKAWVNVKLEEMRAVLTELDARAPLSKAASDDCECCFGSGLQGDGETPCPCTETA